MAITTPGFSTSIQTPEGGDNSALAGFLQGLKGAQEQGMQAAKSKQALGLEQQAANNALKEKLQGISAQGAQDQQTNASKLKGEEEAFKRTVADAPEGGSTAVGPFHRGVDPTIVAGKARAKEQSSALDKVQSDYSKTLPKIQDQMQSLGELKDVLANPDKLSLGQAKTLIIKAFGMSRYNNSEADANVPPSLRSIYDHFANMGGANNSSLDPDAIRDLTKLGTSQTQNLIDKHDTIKANAINGYELNPRHDQSQSENLKARLGAPVSAHLSDLMGSYAGLGKQLDAAQAAAPTGGLGATVGKVVAPLSTLILGAPGGAQAEPNSSPLSPKEQQELQSLKLRFGSK